MPGSALPRHQCNSSRLLPAPADVAQITAPFSAASSLVQRPEQTRRGFRPLGAEPLQTEVPEAPGPRHRTAPTAPPKQERFPFTPEVNHREPPKRKEKEKKPKKAVAEVVLTTVAKPKVPQNGCTAYIDGRPAAPIRAAGP